MADKAGANDSGAYWAPELSSKLLATQSSLLSDIVNGVTLRDALEHLVLSMERLAPGTKASVLLAEGNRLWLGAAPSLPCAYNRVVDGMPIGEGLGSCGTSAHRGELVAVEDIQTDPLWKNYRDIARRHGLAACWSAPIVGRSRRVLGTFAVYYEEPRRPRPDELWLLREFSALAGIAVDYHRMEDQLRVSQSGFRTLVDELDVIVWEADAATRQFTYVSRRAENILGYPLERWCAEPGFWESLIYPEDREVAVLRRREGASAGVHYESEYRMVAADGRIVWFRDRVCPRRDARGQVRLSGVMANISRQRESEQERELLVKRQGEERSLLQAIVEQSPEGVVVVEAPSGRILTANRRAETYLDLRIRVGATLDEYAGWLSRPVARAIRQGETAIDEELLVPHADGPATVLAVSSAPVRDREGRIVAGVAIFSNVTERKRQEAAQRLLVDAGSAIGSSLDPEVAVRDVASLATKEFADWCAVFIRMTEHRVRCAAFCHRNPEWAARKVDLDRLLPQPGGAPFRLSAVLESGGAQLISEVIPDDFEPGAVHSDIARLVRDLGTQSAILVPLQRPGRILGAILFASARPERRYVSEDLSVAEELARRTSLAVENGILYHEAQERVRHREQFLAIAAHELRTPLAALQLNIQAILKQLGKADASRQALLDRARAGQSQTLRLARLIDDLLDVSVVRAGRLHLSREPVDLVPVLHRVVGRCRDELAARGVEVVVHAPSPVVGSWDPLRIEQVITNLVSNGIKFGEDRGVRIAVEAKGGTAILRVEDRGIGMDAAFIERAFQPFERGVATGLRFRGLGLGLYITAEIVKAHEGTISVQSVPGEGSTFVVELPLMPHGS